VVLNKCHPEDRCFFLRYYRNPVHRRGGPPLEPAAVEAALAGAEASGPVRGELVMPAAW
jgi:hypothetical protein